MRIAVVDSTPAGAELATLFLDGIASPIRLRDLIRHRVREEVARYNADPGPMFAGLVQPAGWQAGDGHALSRPRLLDCEVQADTAVNSFERNGFFVFVGDRQVDDLDEELALTEADLVSFVKLVPLAGG